MLFIYFGPPILKILHPFYLFFNFLSFINATKLQNYLKCTSTSQIFVFWIGIQKAFFKYMEKVTVFPVMHCILIALENSLKWSGVCGNLDVSWQEQKLILYINNKK